MQLEDLELVDIATREAVLRSYFERHPFHAERLSTDSKKCDDRTALDTLQARSLNTSIMSLNVDDRHALLSQYYQTRRADIVMLALDAVQLLDADNRHADDRDVTCLFLPAVGPPVNVRISICNMYSEVERLLGYSRLEITSLRSQGPSCNTKDVVDTDGDGTLSIEVWRHTDPMQANPSIPCHQGPVLVCALCKMYRYDTDTFTKCYIDYETLMPQSVMVSSLAHRKLDDCYDVPLEGLKQDCFEQAMGFNTNVRIDVINWTPPA